MFLDGLTEIYEAFADAMKKVDELEQSIKSGEYLPTRAFELKRRLIAVLIKTSNECSRSVARIGAIDVRDAVHVDTK